MYYNRNVFNFSRKLINIFYLCFFFTNIPGSNCIVFLRIMSPQFMSSIAELRERLKARKKDSTSLPYTTCVEILTKMNKCGRFGSPGLVFSLDGQEVMTLAILDKEILDGLLSEEFRGRCRVSELSRSLNVSEDTVLSRIKYIGEITLYLNDVIHDSWFKNIHVESIVGRFGGEMKIPAFAECVGLSVALIEARVHFPDGAIVRLEPDGIATRRFFDNLKRRVRGTLNGLECPRDVAWIGKQVGCPSSVDIEKIVREMVEIGNDKVYSPRVWKNAQIENAHTVWNRLGWIPLSGLRLEIGSGRTDLSRWLQDQNLTESVDCFVLSNCVVRVTAEVLLDVREWISMHSWFDVRVVVGAKVGCPISSEDDETVICLFLKDHVLELGTGWTVSGPFMFSHRLVVEAARERNPGQWLERKHEIFQETFPPYYDLISKIEKAKGRVMDDSNIEDNIVSQFLEIADACQAVKDQSQFEQIAVEALIRPMVTSVVGYAALRFCNSSSVPIDILKALPTVGGAPSPYEEPICSLIELVDSPSLPSVDALKQLLADILILVPKKSKHNSTAYVTEYRNNFDSATTRAEIFFTAIKLIVCRLCGQRRVPFVTLNNSVAVWSIICESLQPQVRDLLKELETIGSDVRRMFVVKDLIANQLNS